MIQTMQQYTTHPKTRWRRLRLVLLSLITLITAVLLLPPVFMHHYIVNTLKTSDLKDVSYQKFKIGWHVLKFKNLAFKTTPDSHHILIGELKIHYSPFALIKKQVNSVDVSDVHIDYHSSPSLMPPFDEAVASTRSLIPLLHRLQKINLHNFSIKLMDSILPVLDIKIIDQHPDKLLLSITNAENDKQTGSLMLSLQDNTAQAHFSAPSLALNNITLSNLIIAITQQAPELPTQLSGQLTLNKIDFPEIGHLQKPLALSLNFEKKLHKTTGKVLVHQQKQHLTTTTFAVDEQADNASEITTKFNKVDLAKLIKLSSDLGKELPFISEWQKSMVVNGTLRLNNFKIIEDTFTFKTSLFGGTIVLKEVKSIGPHLLAGLQTSAVLKDLDLNKLGKLAATENLTLEGRVSGTGVFQISAAGVSIQRGSLQSITTGGKLNYQNPASSKDLPNETKLALTALEDFHFKFLDIEVKPSNAKADDLQAKIKILGSNPHVLNNYPFEFNIQTTGKLGDLLKNSLTSFSQPQTLKEVKQRYGDK